MAFQPVPDTAEIDIIFTLNGETCQNVFYAELEGGYTLADLQALADAVDIQWDTAWKADQPPEVLYVRTEVRGLANENDFLASANASAGAGTNVSSALPNNVTFAVKKESGLTGRSARGRTYWIGIPQAELSASDENTLNSAYVTAVVSNVNAIRTVINVTGLWVAVLVSRFTAGAQRSEGKTFVWVATTNVNNVIDTQRGRLPK